jgi:PAS domain S-box-containing protein
MNSAQRLVASEQARMSLIAIVSQRTSTAIILTDAAGFVIWTNHGFEAMTGYSMADMAGRKPGHVLQGPLSDLSAVDRLRHAQQVGEACNVQLVNYTKAGHPYWTALEMYPVRDESGEVRYFLALQRDVTNDRLKSLTQRLQLEALEEVSASNSVVDALRGAALKISRGMNWSHVAWFPVEAGNLREGEWLGGGEISGANLQLAGIADSVRGTLSDEGVAPAAHYGDWVSRRMVVPGTPFVLFVLACGRPAWGAVALIARQYELGVNSQALVHVLDHVGESISRAGERLSLLRSLEEAKLHAEALSEERLQVARQLKDANDKLLTVARATALHTMIGGVAHELSQPLTALGTYLGILRAGLAKLDPRPPLAIGEALEKAGQQQYRCSEVINRLREFTGATVPAPVPVRIDDLLDEAAALYHASKRDDGRRISIIHGDKSVVVIADRMQLQLVIFNLLQNAAEASASAPCRDVEIRTAVMNGSLVKITVSDRGTGVPMEVARRLFQPFVTSKSDGTGTGLAVCRMIVESYGGSIWYEPRPGGGASFSFTLRYSRASG